MNTCAAEPTDPLTVARAEALFASDVPTGARLSRAQATAVVCRAVQTYHGVRGCAVEVAGAFGDYPETAAARMLWARSVAIGAYQERCAGLARHLSGAAAEPRWPGAGRQLIDDVRS